ncbi:MAG TPA: serine/threonine-protein kinase [Candidatus Polarisedimenticolaceae bacterium]|nr:serine/threonine-protein kinase [Candidatus Polarisedimenticolaceae bacterium]
MTSASAHAISPVLDARFLVVETLGRGGQGTVYRAFDRLTRRDVALKTLHPVPDLDPVHPLVAEFAAWSRLRHPHVVRAYEMGRARSGPLEPGTPYLVLELVRGLPVHRAMRAGATSGEAVEEVGRRLLRALDHVHRAGLVHRDLKPGNVLVGPGRRGPGRVKLTDFGLASPSGLAGAPGRISGSIPYVAPERILGLPLDGRADLYGLGILLFYLATGRLPLLARSPQRWLRWHLAGPPADPRVVRPEIPARLADLVIKLTARDRDARPPTAAEALALLGPAPPAAPRASASHLTSSQRAALRMALDAARRGESREIVLPPGAARQELSVAAAAMGLAVHRLRRPSGIAEVVLTLLLARGSEAQATALRHGLARGLPLSFVGGVPVWDRSVGAPPPRAVAVLARGVAAFLVAEARRRPLALVVEPGATRDPLAGTVVAILRRSVSSPRPRSCRGLLLALSPCARSRCRRTPST